MTTRIVSNGSKWYGQDPDDLTTLLGVLEEHPLIPHFGNCECEHEGAVHFLGNFSDVSHVFNVRTTDQDVISKLRAAIAANRNRPVEDAKRRLTAEVARSINDGDSLCIQEADQDVNDASRAVIAAMAAARGECYLGHVNLYRERVDIEDDDHEPGNPRVAIWKWSGKTVCNFGCSFVLPTFDAELERLILDRDAAPYTGTADDYVRVTAIHDRVESLGGVMLAWG